MSKESDFENRLLIFSSDVIELCKSIPWSVVTKPIVDQLIRSATSIGANYCEANNASSRQDFKSKIFICKKEAQETKYWLKLLLTTASDRKVKIETLIDECHQFSLIFQKIVSTMSK